jgi:hypothetical protein
MARSAYDLTPGYRARGVDDRRAARWLLYAGTMLGLIGLFNVIQGVSALNGSDVYPANAVLEFGNMHLWGWIVFIAGLAAIVASFAIFLGATWARWYGVAAGVSNAFTQLLFIPAYPLWALAAFALDLLVIKALVVHGGSRLLDR